MLTNPNFSLFQMTFQWHHVNNVNPNITLDQFVEQVNFENYATDYYEISYPGLILNIKLSRKVNYHLINSYIPSCLFVIVAWLSLFINPEAIPGRVSMVMMTLLTLMAMFSGIRQSTPKVSFPLHDQHYLFEQKKSVNLTPQRFQEWFIYY